VERVRLWSPPVHERGDQQGIEVEPRQTAPLGESQLVACPPRPTTQ
jgi:hypothetical protein